MNSDFDMQHLYLYRKIDQAKHSLGGQKGVSLIIVMMILTIVSILGVAGVQIAIMSERGARNDRDMQIAWQGAEAGLMDAEFDIFGPGASARRALFQSSRDITPFVNGCGTSGNNIGLCSLVTTGKAAWLTADFEDVSSSAPTTQFGQYTGRSFASGTTGVQPVRAPRYVIEPIRDNGDRDLGATSPKYVYRVTSMGYGPRADIQAVVQMVYRF